MISAADLPVAVAVGDLFSEAVTVLGGPALLGAASARSWVGWISREWPENRDRARDIYERTATSGDFGLGLIVGLAALVIDFAAS